MNHDNTPIIGLLCRIIQTVILKYTKMLLWIVCREQSENKCKGVQVARRVLDKASVANCQQSSGVHRAMCTHT